MTARPDEKPAKHAGRAASRERQARREAADRAKRHERRDAKQKDRAIVKEWK